MKKYWIFVIFMGLSSGASAAPNRQEKWQLEQNDLDRFLKSYVISAGGNFLINWASFRREYRAGGVGLLRLSVISQVEVLKNLVNYVLTENSAQLVTSMATVMSLNWLRTKLGPGQVAPGLIMMAEMAMAEVLKNRLNFVVTEGHFPKKWSRPPSH